MNLLRLSLRSTLLSALLTLPLPVTATGDYWVSPSYLDGAGHELKSPPEFFWHLEVQRLALKYRDKESARMKIRGAGDPRQFLSFNYNPGEAKDEKPVAVADLADFEDALKTGRLKPANPVDATNAHEAARYAIDAGRPLPGGETDSEFADYHQGAAAPLTPEAAAAWQKLLARPKEERHYRSVWAAFMLGKNALAANKWTDAVPHFEQCRAFAREGFADSLTLAADSYGWQGRAELMAEHYPQAARLYLTQLALGDYSAVVSLKRVIPQWTPASSGGLPDEPLETDPDRPAVPPVSEEQGKAEARWLEAARDPALQELVTAHVLATGSVLSTDEGTRTSQWLEVINKAGLKKVEDATALAWVAYTAGDYKASRGWLAKDDGSAPLARWLEAKFALRDGKLEAAGRIMPDVVKRLPASERVDLYVTPYERARGEAASLLYGKGQYVEAFHTFLEGNCDEDMKFLIESILTPRELLDIAANLPALRRIEVDDATATANDYEQNERLSELRFQIGRRLVREGKVKEGRAFLGEDDRQVMDEYIALTQKAENTKLHAVSRARAWWEAGVIMKERGHGFRGTEEDHHRPASQPSDWTVRNQRLSGKFERQVEVEPSEQAPGKQPVFIPVSSKEKKRLAATARQHAKPMRTRVIAAGHLLKGAALLPDGSEEKARMLNTAGYWLQDIDNPAADRIYYRIEKDFDETPTGKAILEKHWFIGESEPAFDEGP